jgi:predicted transposase/invertase (TIGR01784 family)
MGYKRILSEKKYFISLLHDFIHEDWAKEICEDDVELIDKEFILKDLEDRESDIIYRMKIKNRIVVFYFLLELQSKVDFTIPFRLLNYILDLYNRLFKDTSENRRRQKNFRLPVVIPCILYNGVGNWTAARSFREYLDEGDLFEKYAIDFRYILIDINRLSDEDLYTIGSLVSSVFALDKERTQKSFLQNFAQVIGETQNLTAAEKMDLKHWLGDVFAKKNGEHGELVKRTIDLLEKGEVEDMTYAIERMIDEVEERGEKRGLQYGELANTVKAIRNAIKLGQSISLMAKIFDLSPEQADRFADAIRKNQNLSDMELAKQLLKEE